MSMLAADKVVLVVDAALEDCVQLGTTLRRGGYMVVSAGSLAEGRMLLDALTPAVVVFDRSLPDGDGLDLVAPVHQAHPDAFLVALSDRADEVDRLEGFELGVDDYVAKPFSPQEVAFRIQAMLRRAASGPRAATHPAADAESAGTIRIGSLVLDRDTYEVRVDSELVALTPVEFQLLLALVEHANIVLSRDQLVDRVWGANWNGDSHALDVHVSNLRRKLSRVPRDQTFVRSVRGVGYRLGACTPERQLAGAC